MNRFSIMLWQFVILVVLFGNVRCAGNKKLWEFVHKAQELWGVTMNRVRGGNDNAPPLVIKLKELQVPQHPSYYFVGTFEDAYIIYGSERAGKYFELAAVLGNGRGGSSPSSPVQGDGTKIVTSIAKLSFDEMEMDPTMVKQNLVKVRPQSDDEFTPYYRLVFNSYEQAKEIYDRYAAYWPKQAPLPLGLGGKAAPYDTTPRNSRSPTPVS